MAEVEFAGEKFAAEPDGIALMALMRFAHVAKGGTDSNDLDGLAAMYDLLEQAVAAEDWERFQRHAMKVKAKGDDLMAVVRSVIQAASARPTGRPSDSSVGPTIVAPSSGDVDSGAPYLRVIRREEESGRPDRALMVLMAHEAMASTA